VWSLLAIIGRLLPGLVSQSMLKFYCFATAVCLSHSIRKKKEPKLYLWPHTLTYKEETERWKMMKLIFTMCIASEEGAVLSKEQSLVPGR
jgi:hypothetical protein